MFGYVKIDAPELRVREAEFYRAAYCGLCRTMRKNLGITSAAALSYDMVFLIAVRMALSGEKYELRRRTCPKLKPRLMVEGAPSLMYAAGASALLTVLKLEDDIRDERGAKRLLRRAALPISRRHLRRAGADGELADFVRGRLEDICRAEADGGSGEAAFGELLGAIFAHGLKGNDARIANTIGTGVGRVIYIVDAVDDIEEDRRANRYNPIASAWEGLPLSAAKDAVGDAVRLTLSSAAAAAELIDDRDGAPEAKAVVRNVLYAGLLREAERIISKWNE